ncbi:hypothetical protein [Rhodothalassium salexigens]|nr:hypothetical protein [Rhodothalassium salexigens]MBB4212809.1 hypothetical protein [Rhodothalassium salexigens DSM 2132]
MRDGTADQVTADERRILAALTPTRSDQWITGRDLTGALVAGLLAGGLVEAQKRRGARWLSVASVGTARVRAASGVWVTRMDGIYRARTTARGRRIVAQTYVRPAQAPDLTAEQIRTLRRLKRARPAGQMAKAGRQAQAGQGDADWVAIARLAADGRVPLGLGDLARRGLVETRYPLPGGAGAWAVGAAVDVAHGQARVTEAGRRALAKASGPKRAKRALRADPSAPDRGTPETRRQQARAPRRRSGYRSLERRLKPQQLAAWAKILAAREDLARDVRARPASPECRQGAGCGNVPEHVVAERQDRLRAYLAWSDWLHHRWPGRWRWRRQVAAVVLDDLTITAARTRFGGRPEVIEREVAAVLDQAARVLRRR